jgi:hypothetical protein
MTSTLIEDGPLLTDDEQHAVPEERTRVLVVDDHRTFAELLARALDAESDLECVGHAQDSGEAFAAVERLRPDVVLMDVHLPDRDGICSPGSPPSAKATRPMATGTSHRASWRCSGCSARVATHEASPRSWASACTPAAAT